MFSLLKYLKGYKKNTLLTMVFAGVEVFIECLIPFLVSMLVNSIKDGIVLDKLLFNGALLVFFAFLSLSLGYLSAVNASKSSSGFAMNVREAVFEKIQSFSFTNIDRFSSASLVTRLTTDISNVQQTFNMLTRLAIRAPLMVIISFTMAYFMGGQLALIYLSVAPILAIGIVCIIRVVLPIYRKLLKKMDHFNNLIQENIKGIRVVKAFVREEYEIDKFKKQANDMSKDYIKADRIIALLDPLMQFCLYVLMVIVLGIGSYLIISSRGDILNVGQFSALFAYNWQILISLMMMGMVFANLSFSLESIERLNEVLNEESTLVSKEDGVTLVEDGSIEFKNVFFSYNADIEKSVLRDINVKIKSGETIGILGSTGSSKSSFVSLIARLYDTTSGDVLVGNVNVKDYEINALRDQVAMVLQKNVLFTGTIEENLRWGNPDATFEELVEACKIASAHNFIMDFADGYQTQITQSGSNVSGGQKQRLCIARALLKKPKILILDDSTSAVDTATDKKIREAFKSLMPDTTKIIISQRVSSISEADRILVFDQGQIIDEGTHQQLMSREGLYQQVATSQMAKE